MIEKIVHNNKIYAIIIYNKFEKEGIVFVSPPEFSLQLGYINHPAGHKISPHVHNLIARETLGTQEVLFIKSGLIRIDLYSEDEVLFESRNLSGGDVILLSGAGHGITIIESTVMIEVKNGPYFSEEDKKRF
jgi:hypothetical protein